jgi:hypothetical protein
VLDNSQLYLITFIPEEGVHDPEQILFSETFTKKLRHFMKTFAEGNPYTLIIGFQEFFVDLPEIRFPPLSTYCIKDSWKVIGTAVDDLILFA